jgi:hypothetical protein
MKSILEYEFCLDEAPELVVATLGFLVAGLDTTEGCDDVWRDWLSKAAACWFKEACLEIDGFPKTSEGDLIPAEGSLGADVVDWF